MSYFEKEDFSWKTHLKIFGAKRHQGQEHAPKAQSKASQINRIKPHQMKKVNDINDRPTFLEPQATGPSVSNK
jgi:hypothetical protein